MERHLVFGITTAPMFFEKAREDHKRLAGDIANPGAAMNSVLSLYHLHEWVWSCWLKSNAAAQARLGVRNNKQEFIGWLDANCPYFRLLQELANGTKHCFPVHSTDKLVGYGRGPFGIGPHGAAYLLIDLGDGVEDAKRYLVASTILEEIIQFWEAFFADNGIRDRDKSDAEREAGRQE